MTRIFVAQTQPRDKTFLCEFLTSSGFSDIRQYGTDPVSLTFLTKEMMVTQKPFVIITSQRDMFDCEYIPNMLQTAVSFFPVDTLTIVYTRAAARQEHMRGVSNYFAQLVSNNKHQIKIVPKISDETRDSECATIKAYLEVFEHNLKKT